MQSLGIRAARDRYIYVILDGTQTAPAIVEKGICRPPADSTWPAVLRWAREDLRELLTKHEIGTVHVKTVEGNARTKDPHRLQLEGVFLEGSQSHPTLPSVSTVVSQQIKSRTGFTDFARYMQNQLLTDDLAEVGSATYGEAALAALAGLPKE